jgi:hypothetical protein
MINTFLSSGAVALSILACLLGGFAAYRVFSLEQDVRAASRSVANLEKSQTSLTQRNIAALATSDIPSSPANITGTSISANNTSVQPGQFVQPALGNKGRVELLGAKRIQDPETGTRDVVNVLFRVYQLAADVKFNPSDPIILDRTTARNPNTSETYKAYGDKRSELAINLSSVKKDIPEDGYVWLKVPEGVNTLDIYIPETQVFKNVPIAN